MAEIAGTTKAPLVRRASPWSELFSKEDWWAIWIGLGLIAAASLLFVNGGSIKWLAVAPQKWSHLPDVLTQLQQNGLRYGALFALWALLFGLGLHRSEERRVGKECSLPCRSRWSPYH